MTDTTQLPESICQRINKDSETAFPISGKVRNCGEYDYDQLQDRKQIGYVKGATAEATRSLVLVEALEKIAEGKQTNESVYDFMVRVKFLAHCKITEYNLPTP